MKTSMIDNDKKERDRCDSGVSNMLNTFMQSQFEATIAKFQDAELPRTSPLHGLMSVGFSKNISQSYAPENLSSISTSYRPKNVTPAEPKMEFQVRATEGDPEIQSIVQQASQRHGVPVALINAVIKQESNFNTNAISHAGARGLMQLMPATAKAYGCQDSFNPTENIMAGTKFLGDLLTKYKGDVKLTLAAYNAGPGNVAKYGNTIPPFKETQNYVVRVGDYYQANLKAVENSSKMFTQLEDRGSGLRT